MLKSLTVAEALQLRLRDRRLIEDVLKLVGPLLDIILLQIERSHLSK
jgi:hypothetical protein